MATTNGFPIAANPRLAFPTMAALLAMAGLLLGIVYMEQQQRSASYWVTHTLQVLEAASKFEADLEAAVSEGRGFALSRNDAERLESNQNVDTVHADLAGLLALTTDNAVQQDEILRLRALVDNRIAALRQGMDRAVQREPPPAPTQSGGPQVMKQVLESLQLVKQKEERLLVRRQQWAAMTMELAMAGTLGCCLTVAGAVVFILSSHVRRRRDGEQAALLQVNFTLEAQAADRAAALARSEARQRCYFDCTPVGVLVLRRRADGEFIHEDLNPAFESLGGFRRAALVGRTVTEIWPAVQAADMSAKLQSCVSGRKVLRFATQRMLRGSLCNLDVSLAPFIESSGTVDLVIASVRDVTLEQALQTEVLAQSEQRAQAAEREMAYFRNCEDVLFVAQVLGENDGLNFKYESLSPAYEKMTGSRVSDVIGRRIEECLPPDVAEFVSTQYRSCALRGSTMSYAASYAFPNGKVDVETSVTPVRDSQSGQVVRLIGVARDVSERNRLESALRQSQKMEAIGRMAAGVAHDFNNILQVVIGSIELILDDISPTDRLRTVAETALNTAERGAYLTRHLLSYARKQVLRPKAVEPARLLAEVRNVLARLVRADVSVELRIDPQTPSVLADPAQLQTALLNLAINANQAMPEGGRMVIEARPEATNDDLRVVLAVVDSGIGMDEETLAHAAEPFFSTKGVAGSGLGLSMAQGFCEQSGGSLAISSRPGAGTRIELRLPSAPPEAVEIGSPAPGAASGGGRILLVDDASDVLVTTGAFLAKAGFSVVQARNGDEALALLGDTGHFDALVTDYAMPGLNGLDLIVEGRVIRPTLPALIITGFASVEGRGPLPADVPLLHKPVSRAVLIDALNRIIASETVMERKSL